MSTADIGYHMRRVLTKYLDKRIEKSKTMTFSAQTLETHALQAQLDIRKTSTNEERRKVALLWYEAALTRDTTLKWELWGQLLEKDIRARRDVAMAAYDMVRTLPWLDIDDIFSLRFGIEMLCSDPHVAEIMPKSEKNDVRHNNLVHLLLCSVTLVGTRCIVDTSTLKSTIEGLRNSNNPDIRDCLDEIIGNLTEVSPETAKILSGFIEG